MEGGLVVKEENVISFEGAPARANACLSLFALFVFSPSSSCVQTFEL